MSYSYQLQIQITCECVFKRNTSVSFSFIASHLVFCYTSCVDTFPNPADYSTNLDRHVYADSG